jgi:hypothetical protein
MRSLYAVSETLNVDIIEFCDKNRFPDDAIRENAIKQLSSMFIFNLSLELSFHYCVKVRFHLFSVFINYTDSIY